MSNHIEVPVVRRYRKTGLDVEAICFVPLNQIEVANWCKGKLTVIPRNGDESRPDPIIVIRTIDGEIIARLGDYIIKIDDENFYTCNAETFIATYEEMDNGA